MSKILDYATGNKPLYRYQYQPQLGFSSTWYLGALGLLMGLLVIFFISKR
jgi:hypothetical protein